MIEQGTPEWFAERCGKATASRIADIMRRTKSGPAASRKNYAAQLIAERLTGNVAESYTNAAMQHGTETEPDARRHYAFMTDNKVDEVGFVPHPTIGMAGASPDGLVGEAGLVEIKCPNTATHIETLLTEKVTADHATQMQWQMACTGRQWCDFVSFDPRLPVEMQMFVSRLDRDCARIEELETAVAEFLAEIDKTVAELRGRFMSEAA